MFGLAGAAKYLVYATHHIDEAYRLAELFVLTVGWVGLTAIVTMLVLSAPGVGLVAGGFLLYAAADAFPRIPTALGRAGRRTLAAIRCEHVALRRDDPQYKPAVVPPVWSRK
jgi:hypothetical protein